MCAQVGSVPRIERKENVALTEVRYAADKPLFDLGYHKEVVRCLDQINMQHQVFYNVTPDPTLACIHDGLANMKQFRYAQATMQASKAN